MPKKNPVDAAMDRLNEVIEALQENCKEIVEAFDAVDDELQADIPPVASRNTAPARPAQKPPGRRQVEPEDEEPVVVKRGPGRPPKGTGKPQPASGKNTAPVRRPRDVEPEEYEIGEDPDDLELNDEAENWEDDFPEEPEEETEPVRTGRRVR